MAYKPKQIEEIFTKIIRLISDEGYSLRKCLREDWAPKADTFYKWVDADVSKMERYTRATELRSELIFEECLEIADDKTDQKFTDERGNLRFDTGRSQDKRIKIDVRKWMLGKMNPTKYSDKIQVDNTPFKEQPLFPIKDD